MKQKTYNNFINKLNSRLTLSTGQISPTPTLGGRLSRESIILTKGMSVESLSEENLYLAHTLLHKFYSGGSKSLKRKDIEQLHREIKEKIKHFDFDKLDLK